MNKKNWLMLLLISFLGFLGMFLTYTVQAYAYTPHLPGPVDYGIKGSKKDSWVSGRKLVYDIYSGVDGKEKWQITNRDYGYGSQPYLEFSGWSALLGWHHHSAGNQKTYIWAQNQRTGKSLFYLAEMKGLSASKDLEYNRQSPTGPIYKPCSEGTYNTSNESCNMYYDHVGFTAYIPLQELFPEGVSDDVWELRIIKNVDGRVVYDELKLPFHFDSLRFGSGEISLDSGIDAESLRMIDSGVVRRNYPRESGWSGGRYFTPGNIYQRITQNEENTVVWYGVTSPHDGNAVRWASGAYWRFEGKPAILSYKRRVVQATIRHVDANTKKLLREDKKELQAGEHYQLKPEPKGTFADENGNPYVASPAGQVFEGTAEPDMSFTFTYKASLPDPSKPGGGADEGFTDGQAKGEFLWELRRTNPSKPSQVLLNSDFSVTGKHFAVRNTTHQVSVPGVFSKKKEKPIQEIVDTGKVIGKGLSVDFSYEYTNHYNENYVCTEKQNGECFKWEFKDKTPDWTKAETYHLSKLYGSEVTVPIDPTFGKRIELPGAKSLQNQQFTVGRKKGFEGSRKPVSKTYYEGFKLSNASEAKDVNQLETQSWLNLSPGVLEYQVELPTDSHTASSFAFLNKNGGGDYYPVDVDKSLQSKYANQTPDSYSAYAFPLAVEKLTDQGIQGGKRQYQLGWTSDYFFPAEHTGFIQSYPYAKRVKEGRKPSQEEIKRYIEEQAKQQYKQQTGQDWQDSFLHLEHPVSRYYLPIEADSKLKPKEQYENKVVLRNMGLNDVTFVYGQTFSFDRYLVGNVLDDAYVVEQHDPLVPMSSYPHQVTVKREQQQAIYDLLKDQVHEEKLFGFRRTNRGFYDRVNKIVNLGL
ncbi:hypothetical protein [Paenibacillus larvae]|uniref:Uncharacterized protein n=2 Tax=Paenibacillus larvae TaxID=1464 RepID=V9W420_9BACL|nr:hypothetical protein [Paenibacillus larvae]AHD04709.1 hypothetical protein ERIC2_c08760 [Paenibacillus larvae subsp. larvae DSM 25430]MDR5566961.1 hypothetical protein [Paenibacillus larvae]MDR5595044.1 hypothetical protein [Paenibacillus larvae]